MKPELQQTVDIARGAEVLQASGHLNGSDIGLLAAGGEESRDVTVMQPLQLAQAGDTQRLVAAVLPGAPQWKKKGENVSGENDKVTRGDSAVR